MEHEAEFEEYLNEVYPSVTIAGIEFPAGTILKDCDPIAYRVTYSDWEDSMGYGE